MTFEKIIIYGICGIGIAIVVILCFLIKDNQDRMKQK